MSENIDIYSELDRYVEENMGEVSKTDIATHFFALGQKDAINKACEWLEENIDSYLSSVVASLGYSDYVLDWNFINDLKKAMKNDIK